MGFEPMNTGLQIRYIPYYEQLDQQTVVADCFERMENCRLVVDRQTPGLQVSQKIRWRHRRLRIWVQREWGHREVQMSKPPGAHSRRKRRGGYGLNRDR